MLYLGGVIAFLESTSTTMFRSMISKNVHANEVGKVFSVVGTIQALIPFISSPTFGYLYKATLGNASGCLCVHVRRLQMHRFHQCFDCSRQNDPRRKGEGSPEESRDGQ